MSTNFYGNGSFNGIKKQRKEFSKIVSSAVTTKTLFTKEKSRFEDDLNVYDGTLNILKTSIQSKNLTGSQGFTVGYPVDKDMNTTGCDSLDGYKAPNGIPISSGIDSSYWDDWDDDIFDDWGFFYIFDVATNEYFFPIFNSINLDDGIISTETFDAFGRTYTIKHGYPAQGIYKFDISCSDDSEFIFGAYGDMGSDSNTINTNYTQSYSLNGETFTLYYNRNIEDGDAIERFFSYFVPYEKELNNTKTYSDFLDNDDELSLYSVPVKHGIIVYFSKKTDVYKWVINDLTFVSNNFSSGNSLNVSGNVFVSGNVLSSKTNLGKRNLVIGISDSDYESTASNLVNGYFTSSELTDNRNFTLPSASQIVASIPNCVVGTSFEFTVNNVQNGNYNRNIVEGSNTSFESCYITSIPQNTVISYLCVVTSIETENEYVKICQL